MRASHESDVTAVLQPTRPSGVWAFGRNGNIIAVGDGPATLLVPTEQVLLLAVDLPLASRAKRLSALPFAIEDRIAEPVESVHLALGETIAPKRYLVGVIRHAVMREWVARAEAEGLGHAAMVPDALALPDPGEGGWSVELSHGRAVARTGDGTGFAIPEALLAGAWEAAGRPRCTASGDPLPEGMRASAVAAEYDVVARRLASPPLDLRQGAYPRRGVAPDGGNGWRRLGWIVAAGAAAHATIAFADTMVLRGIAQDRASETRALAVKIAPNANTDGDLAATLPPMLPGPGAMGAGDGFVSLVNRVSSALAPVGALNVTRLDFATGKLVFDIAGGDPALADRLRTALAAASVKADVAESPDGMIHITASAA